MRLLRTAEIYLYICYYFVRILCAAHREQIFFIQLGTVEHIDGFFRVFHHGLSKLCLRLRKSVISPASVIPWVEKT